jgi:RNA polymerase sigma factor for flagellar operon FliA
VVPSSPQAGAEIYRQQSSDDRCDELVRAHLGLVHKAVGRMATELPTHIDREELYSAGVIGLLKAARSFDASRGTEFATFAYPRIAGEIIDELRRLSPLTQRMLSHSRKIRHALETLPPYPTDEQLSTATGLSIDEVEETRRALHRTALQSWEVRQSTSMDQPLSAEPPPWWQAENHETKVRLAWSIRQLPPREQAALNMYFFEELTLREIGEVLEITESRVSKIIHRAIERLRELMDEPGT